MAKIAGERGRVLELHREGGSHSIYRIGGNPMPIAVPRHTEISELTARGILDLVRRLSA
ncbi:hypothetical protein [Longispora albida]|uniref:hypothetical protein n=1 Tax=Longispora albida TaxID=203523 RepID=UPI00036DEB95|nr:hypothetical protein [Longispora albida]